MCWLAAIFLKSEIQFAPALEPVHVYGANSSTTIPFEVNRPFMSFGLPVFAAESAASMGFIIAAVGVGAALIAGTRAAKKRAAPSANTSLMRSCICTPLLEEQRYATAYYAGARN